MTELIPVVELFDLVKVRLVPCIPVEKHRKNVKNVDKGQSVLIFPLIIQKPNFFLTRMREKKKEKKKNTLKPETQEIRLNGFILLYYSFIATSKQGFYAGAKNGTTVSHIRACVWCPKAKECSLITKLIGFIRTQDVL